MRRSISENVPTGGLRGAYSGVRVYLIPRTFLRAALRFVEPNVDLQITQNDVSQTSVFGIQAIISDILEVQVRVSEVQRPFKPR